MWFRFKRRSRMCSSTCLRQFRPRFDLLEDRCLLSAGALDPTFGNGAGYVTTSNSPYGGGAHNALIQPNSDVIAVGSGQMSAGGSNVFSLERYNPDGSLDSFFGAGGIAQASFGSFAARGAYGALYPAGSPYAGDIIQEGIAFNSSVSYQALARYNPDGTLDTTFGPGGEVIFQSSNAINNGWVVGGGVVITNTGQIVALSMSTSGGKSFELVRYNSDGSVDTTFGQGGAVIVGVPGGDPNWFDTLLQQPNGDLIVTHTSGPNGTYNNDSGGAWNLYRFNPNGTLDTSFGNQGIVITAIPGGPAGAALYPNGQILVAGQWEGTGPGQLGPVESARYNANGSLDTTFGTGGTLQTQVNLGLLQQVALDASGRMLLTGDGSFGETFEVARFNVNGTPDTTFGNGGVVSSPIGAWSQSLGLAVYPSTGTPNDGAIVVVGASNDGTKTNVIVARYLPQATAPYFVITGPTSLTAGTSGTFTISVLNPDGSSDPSYSGTMHVTSSDPQALLPANFTITGGTVTFAATLKTAGTQSLSAADTTTPAICGGDASIQVVPGAANHFSISAPSSFRSDSSFSITVTALDAYGNIATGYVGTIHFSDSVSGATLPSNYTFTAADAGVHTFSGLKLKTKGKQTLTIDDTMNALLIATVIISVS